MGRECLKAFLKKRAILQSAYETHVRHGVNERLSVFDGSRAHQVGPELTGEIELGINLQSL